MIGWKTKMEEVIMEGKSELEEEDNFKEVVSALV